MDNSSITTAPLEEADEVILTATVSGAALEAALGRLGKGPWTVTSAGTIYQCCG